MSTPLTQFSRWRRNLFSAVAGCAMAAGMGSASAALLLYDPFNQAAGNIAGTASSGGGSLWIGSGTWAGTGTISAGSLSYGPLLTSGNQANYDAVANGNRLMSSNLGGASSDLWISFLISANRNDSGISLFTGGAEQNFMGNGGGSGQTLGLQNPNINTGIAQSTTTHFYVLHMVTPSSGNISSTLFIDPAISSLGVGAAPTGSLFSNVANPDTTRAAYAFNTIRLGAFAAAGTVRFDELRVGTTWADVSPVPEPSTALLCGLGALRMCTMRRRRLAQD